ncbi:hypothetical protein CK203_110154 [Vitis vinifera]|uniref:Uncharacterized protein n=1 Tax=Vitis vinifera TaxID=29760 RepID=A0A438CP45_VITVI|nr:hypothetical protein CK203_110154 [Vitis vinifera]
MGATYWKFNGDSCQIEMVGLTPQPPRGSEQSIVCENFFEKNRTVLHAKILALPEGIRVAKDLSVTALLVEIGLSGADRLIKRGAFSFVVEDLISPGFYYFINLGARSQSFLL